MGEGGLNSLISYDIFHIFSFVVSEPMEDISDSDDGEEAKKPDEVSTADIDQLTIQHSENEEEEEEEDDKNAGVMRLVSFT